MVFQVKISLNGFNPLKKFNLLVESFKPDAVFVDRQTQFGIGAIKAEIPLLMQLRGNYWDEN